MASINGGMIVAMAVSMVLVGMASAATYNVGEPGGSWDLQTNYDNWVAQKKFHPGDQIVFKYSPQAHDVLEVSKADYDSCSSSNQIGSTLATGNDVVALNATGTRYFICGFPNHCTGGMRIKIDVVLAATAATPGAVPAPTGGPTGANSAPSPPSPSSSASSVKATTVGFAVAVLLAAGLMP